MEQRKKLTYSNTIKSIGVIHMNPGGYEYIYNKQEDTMLYDFEIKSTFNRDDKVGIRSSNANLRKWKKGIKKLIKRAKQGPGTFAKMGKAYHGNGPSNNTEYFWQLYKSMTTNEIIEYSEDDKILVTESYVDGSIETSFK